MTDWEEVYHKYRSLEDAGKRNRLVKSINLFSSDPPHENVYKSALAFHVSQGRPEDWYYRGQKKKSWNITPSLLRESSDIDIDFEIQRLSSAVRFVQSELQVSQPVARAIVQHYSGVPGDKIRTWLIDVTTCPEIAFFFASLCGQTGDVGSVYVFSRDEMETLGSTTPKQLGEIKIISPDGVPRIEKQDAAFIDYSHPKLIEGYTPVTFKFEQDDDIVFEYPEWGITKDNLLAENDKYVELLERWEEEIWPEKLPLSKTVAPEHDPFNEVTHDDYLGIVKQWVDESEISYEDLTQSEKESIKFLCKVHAQVRNDDEISGGLDNEHRLKHTIDLAITELDIRGESIDFDLLMKHYRRTIVHNWEKFNEIVQSVQPDHSFD